MNSRPSMYCSTRQGALNMLMSSATRSRSEVSSCTTDLPQIPAEPSSRAGLTMSGNGESQRLVSSFEENAPGGWHASLNEALLDAIFVERGGERLGWRAGVRDAHQLENRWNVRSRVEHRFRATRTC